MRSYIVNETEGQRSERTLAHCEPIEKFVRFMSAKVMKTSCASGCVESLILCIVLIMYSGIVDSQERGPIPKSQLTPAEFDEIRVNFIANGWSEREVDEYFASYGVAEGYSDQSIRAVFPEISSDSILTSVCSETAVSPISIRYSFAANSESDDRIVVHELSCVDSPDGLYCESTSQLAVSVKGAADFFFVDESISERSATSIAELYYEKISRRLPDEVVSMPIHRISQADNNKVRIELGRPACGCRAELTVSVFRFFGMILSYDVSSEPTMICR